MAVLLMTAPLAGQGLDFQENYDSQTVNKPPGAPWYNIFTGGVWVEDGPVVQSTPYALMINNSFGGKDLGSQALLDGGRLWGASDDCPLTLSYWVYHGSAQQEKFCDIIVELSKGNAHAPSIDAAPLPFTANVVAYCSPFGNKSNNKKYWYFDGRKWGAAGFPKGGWHELKMVIDSGHLTLGTSGTVPRLYTGMFDRISVYTITGHSKQKWSMIDDLSVMGGYTTLTAALDILPNDDPNDFVPNKKSSGRLPMAILGSADLDVTTIDFSTCNIKGVYPVKDKATYKDVNLDGIDDLELKFSRSALIDALGLDQAAPGTAVDVTVSAKVGCSDLTATDVLIIQSLGE